MNRKLLAFYRLSVIKNNYHGSKPLTTRHNNRFKRKKMKYIYLINRCYFEAKL